VPGLAWSSKHSVTVSRRSARLISSIADLLAGQFFEEDRRGPGAAGEQRGDRGGRRRVAVLWPGRRGKLVDCLGNRPKLCGVAEVRMHQDQPDIPDQPA